MTDHIEHASTRKPTERMQRLYHGLAERWGEPIDLICFDGAEATPSGQLDAVHIAIWPPDEQCDVATFCSIGMSEALMVGADYRVEFHLGRRGSLTAEDKNGLAIFLANLTEYPFMHQLKLDWWERLANPGRIPGFPGCTHLLIAPDLSIEPAECFNHFPPPDSDIKILRAIPITPRENQILKDQGRTAFLDYWEETGVDIWSPRCDGDVD